VDQAEAREVGEKAAQFAVWHNVDGSITIHRVGNYGVEYRLTGLEEIAGKTKTMPGEFINETHNGVTEAFYAYARPLVGSGLPTPSRLAAPTVPKILAQ
jgi:6-phosphofructokinase 1